MSRGLETPGAESGLPFGPLAKEGISPKHPWAQGTSPFPSGPGRRRTPLGVSSLLLSWGAIGREAEC